MKRFLHLLKPLVVLAVFVGAVYLLYCQLHTVKYQDLVDGLHQIQYTQIFAAIALTGLNYVVLLGYDVLAIRYIGHRLPLKKIMLASFVGHVCSFNFGSMLGGSSVRYRFYSAWHFSTVEIVQLIAILAVTFWLGVLLIAGIVFIYDPFPMPENIANAIGMQDVRVLGFILLAIVLGYLALCAFWRRPRIGRWESPWPLPPLWLSVGQILVSSLDQMVGAAVFYTLLPSTVDISYLRFLGVFLLGMVSAAFTHVPAGAGVFELVMVNFMPKSETLAPLVVFRGVYYLLPLTIAAILMGAHEIFMGRHVLKRLLRRGQPTESAERPASKDVMRRTELHSRKHPDEERPGEACSLGERPTAK